MNECKPLVDGTRCTDYSCGTDRDMNLGVEATCGDASTGSFTLLGRGLHSSTFQLNVSRFCHEMHPKYPFTSSNTC